MMATRSLPLHRQLWELAPYLMALAGAALAAWSVWQVAGRTAATLTAVLLVCASPATLPSTERSTACAVWMAPTSGCSLSAAL